MGRLSVAAILVGGIFGSWAGPRALAQAPEQFSQLSGVVRAARPTALLVETDAGRFVGLQLGGSNADTAPPVGSRVSIVAVSTASGWRVAALHRVAPAVHGLHQAPARRHALAITLINDTYAPLTIGASAISSGYWAAIPPSGATIDLNHDATYWAAAGSLASSISGSLIVPSAAGRISVRFHWLSDGQPTASVSTTGGSVVCHTVVADAGTAIPMLQVICNA